jgi:hypothetical protein
MEGPPFASWVSGGFAKKDERGKPELRTCWGDPLGLKPPPCPPQASFTRLQLIGSTERLSLSPIAPN